MERSVWAGLGHVSIPLPHAGAVGGVTKPQLVNLLILYLKSHFPSPPIFLHNIHLLFTDLLFYN